MIMIKNPPQSVISEYLKQAKTIAMVGLSDNVDRISHQIAIILQNAGYKIIPVNPLLSGQQILGETVYTCLQDIPFPVDIANIYRKNEYLIDVAKDFVLSDVKIFWAQLGLTSEEADEWLRKNNCDKIIMDCCIKIELAKIKE